MEPASRRAKGTIPLLVESYVNNNPLSRTAFLTPYFIAKQLNLSPGSVTAACKSLVRDDRILCHGESPYLVGPKPESRRRARRP